ncbi:hypothetical protein ABZ714_15135 [Streptomyces sp. NPDC006798]|uniref:hypothetical protein n=1 Tax=Streptomyces sp. NPDC006798 TaxID=3155462 RepID=UPI0033CF6D1B
MTLPLSAQADGMIVYSNRGTAKGSFATNGDVLCVSGGEAGRRTGAVHSRISEGPLRRRPGEQDHLGAAQG